jgi:hypothetical protein
VTTLHHRQPDFPCDPLATATLQHQQLMAPAEIATIKSKTSDEDNSDHFFSGAERSFRHSVGYKEGKASSPPFLCFFQGKLVVRVGGGILKLCECIDTCMNGRTEDELGFSTSIIGSFYCSFAAYCTSNAVLDDYP